MLLRNLGWAIIAGLLATAGLAATVPAANGACRVGGGDRLDRIQERIDALRARVWARDPLGRGTWRQGPWSGESRLTTAPAPAAPAPGSSVGPHGPQPPPSIGYPGWQSPPPPAWPGGYPLRPTWADRLPEPPRRPANRSTPAPPPGRSGVDPGGNPPGTGTDTGLPNLPYANPLPDPWSGTF